MKYFTRLFWISLFLLAGCKGFFPESETSTQDTNQPTAPSTTMHGIPNSPHHVSLLLPLGGQFAKEGQAVRDGFLTAYYAASPTEAKAIDVIDTSKTPNIAAAYQQAMAQQSDLIVGPLSKDHVRGLLGLRSLPVPTLALNYSETDNSTRPNLYKFSLSPQDEARQVADKMWQEGHRSVLIIAPSGNWGQAIADAYRQKWTQLGGQVTETMNYGQPQNFAEQVQTLLHVKQAARHSHSAEKLPSQRNDVDTVFLVAQPAAARQLVPLVKFYASNLAVYSTSLLYTGYPNAGADRDLDGVKFCDMPWVLQPSDPLHAELAKLWPKNYHGSIRLYGLGIDAYKLSDDLHHLADSPGTQVNGVTGTLSLNTQQHIQRQLLWAKFQEGVPVVQ